jgi:hypothetical protein
MLAGLESKSLLQVFWNFKANGHGIRRFTAHIRDLQFVKSGVDGHSMTLEAVERLAAIEAAV